MTIFFSKTQNGFFNSDIHQSMPTDVIEISDELHQSLLQGQSEGRQISADESGNPILVDRSGPLVTKENMCSFIQAALDEKAKEYGYDNIMSAISYADEPGINKFQTEGKAFRLWRSLVWDYVFNSPESIAPADVLANLPEFSLEN